MVYRTYTTNADQHYVYKTSDGGQTWTGIDGSGDGALPDGPVHSIVVDPLNSQVLYVGTELGIFTSVDGGQSWLADANNFGNVPVTHLLLDRSAGVTTLAAVTFGRGIWKTTIPGSGTRCQYDVTKTASMEAIGADVALSVTTGAGCVGRRTRIRTLSIPARRPRARVPARS